MKAIWIFFSFFCNKIQSFSFWLFSFSPKWHRIGIGIGFCSISAEHERNWLINAVVYRRIFYSIWKIDKNKNPNHPSQNHLCRLTKVFQIDQLFTMQKSFLLFSFPLCLSFFLNFWFANIRLNRTDILNTSKNLANFDDTSFFELSI